MSESTEGHRSRAMLERFGPLVTLILLIIATAVCQRLRSGANSFLSLENFRNILANWSFVGIIALGMTFIIISGGIDLSVGSLVAFAGGAGIWMMNTAIDAARIRQEYADAGQTNLPLPYSPFRSELANLMISLHLAGSERGWGGHCGCDHDFDRGFGGNPEWFAGCAGADCAVYCDIGGLCRLSISGDGDD